MQASGNDFIAWNNPYNPVITTLGNPNFSAAVMAIIGVITFSSILIPNFHSAYRIFCVFLTLLLLISIYRTNARQGLLSFVLGLGLFLIIWVFNQNKKIGVMVGLIGLFVLTLSILGILQRGPLEKYLYKETVSIRGFYWQAGLAMFRQNPLFGVGIDSYELYFKQYRDVAYPLKYGYQITSSNAHNTFIQFFATGGFGLECRYLQPNLLVMNEKFFPIRLKVSMQPVFYFLPLLH
ncbi:MAG: O-antigen ligase domain-containing protein [Alphaproteobacteria bacterium]|nr:O-antigen ligase domain-containing protein [Alphaproteobacteria bacterium]